MKLFSICFLLIILVQTQQNLNYFEYGVKVIPHPQKQAKGGEDAYYANSKLLAVADGVGGWQEQGIDPSIYSRTLCQNLGQLYLQNEKKYQNNPKDLIINVQPTVQYLGSSTLVLITIDQVENYIYSSYIGDSGYMIFRYNQQYLDIIFEFEEQQKSFNFPFQLGVEENGDNPQASVKFKHQIQHNDILVIASDGVFDNLDMNQIKNIIENNGKKNMSSNQLNNLADKIAQSAFEFSINQNYNSPFSKKAWTNGIRTYGGKSDDITVIVAQIKLKKEKKEEL
ncbi:t-cell activation protein phosphatase 2c, putative [Ichthyophthirius multifiliis]|uniref:Protein phosphatase n=1 Tax=Ichthyophthirius multifiliis TaxID=5932 RepID=G0QVN0_ICHMU|nr:t-cell activation protein phosphatase 2c, putative [Ichthyophthirius multifiliis]EGR30717.1 t-cell activation protein phosphatase 2c, putative [Ichthyophthirius multifiliis]|eukprot:XP_004032304.1 t-cell activation protein phosphatase 2c, putative [Ichthyophthirius multifiliis]